MGQIPTGPKVRQTEPVMDGKTYISTQMRLIEMGKIANSLDIDAFLKCISNAETMGPMLDPTLYLKAMDNLRAVKKLAEAGKVVQKAYDETFRAVMETAAMGYMQKPDGQL
jgi:hypothetical protein